MTMAMMIREETMPLLIGSETTGGPVVARNTAGGISKRSKEMSTETRLLSYVSTPAVMGYSSVSITGSHAATRTFNLLRATSIKHSQRWRPRAAGLVSRTTSGTRRIVHHRLYAANLRRCPDLKRTSVNDPTTHRVRAIGTATSTDAATDINTGTATNVIAMDVIVPESVTEMKIGTGIWS